MGAFRFLYPADPLAPRRIDEMFAPEAAAVREAGFAASVVELERRFFVLEGRPWAADHAAEIPEPATACAARIASPFFSVDIALREDGAARIVEIGDGQVSDLVGWSPERFAEMWHSWAS